MLKRLGNVSCSNKDNSLLATSATWAFLSEDRLPLQIYHTGLHCLAEDNFLVMKDHLNSVQASPTHFFVLYFIFDSQNMSFFTAVYLSANITTPQSPVKCAPGQHYRENAHQELAFKWIPTQEASCSTQAPGTKSHWCRTRSKMVIWPRSLKSGRVKQIIKL